jgi:hypothetical protein
MLGVFVMIFPNIAADLGQRVLAIGATALTDRSAGLDRGRCDAVDRRLDLGLAEFSIIPRRWSC